VTLPVYPDPSLLRGLSYTSRWKPMFFNMTATTATGADIDVGLSQYPLHDFELNYNFLRDGPDWRDVLGEQEFKTMMGFFLTIGGTLGRFLYRNPADWKVFQTPIGVGDGTTTTFTLTRRFGANGYYQTEPVGQIDVAAGANFYLNGSSSPVLPTLRTISVANPCANTVTFTTAPPNGQAITADLQYFYYCKMGANDLSFDKFMDRLWMLQKVQLHSCRPGA
jgi:hypothetical protein